MIKPTVGRVVLYRPHPMLDSTPIVDAPDTRYAATVAYVHSDKFVNLSVVDSNGNQFAREHVELVQDNEPHVGQCEWMPYQKAVASGAQAPTLHAS